MSDNTDLPNAESGDNSAATPPPFPSLDGSGVVPTVPTPDSDPLTLEQPTVLPNPVQGAAVTGAPAWEQATSTPPAAPKKPKTNAAQQVELFDVVYDAKVKKQIKKGSKKALDDKKFNPVTAAIILVGVGMVALIAFLFYNIVNPTTTTPEGGTAPLAQGTFVYPATLPSALTGQPASTDPADKPIIEQFAAQAAAAGNPRAFAQFYGPTPKVVGTNFIVYGAEMTDQEKADYAAVAPIAAHVNETAVAYVGRGATVTGKDPVAAPGSYGGKTWCQTAELKGAPKGTYCYWSDGTYYVAVARSEGQGEPTEFTNLIVKELGAGTTTSSQQP